MAFHSFSFMFLFLPVTVAGYFLLRRVAPDHWAKIWLIAASLLFYAEGRIQDVPVLVASVTVNCLAGAWFLRTPGGATRSRRSMLVAAIGANVAFLCYYKYLAFFMDTFGHWTGLRMTVPHIAFPLGISFFTIIQIMFLVDCYEGLVEDCNTLDYVLFASFFPYVTMGPIVRWKQVAPQINDPLRHTANADNIASGLYLFTIGLFKKVVLADTFYRWADAGFAYDHPLSLAGGWIAALAFTFQLYFDFSGYTDMALGAALMLNIKLPQNFDAPFRAASIMEFWRRWHITLTNFITTYLYTPMLRSMKKVTFAKALMATFLAMAIAGLWHGANWTFVVFGCLHGVALVINQCWRKLKWPMPTSLGWLLTFVFVIVAMVPFRAAGLSQATGILASMFSARGGLFNYEPWSGIDRVDQLMGLGWMLLGCAILVKAPSSLNLQQKFKPSWVTAAAAIALASISCVYANAVVSKSFVYRDF